MVDVEVEYNYEAEQSDELTIKIGDIIKNVTMSEGGWWEGDLHGKRGMFPDNFVKVVPKKEEGKKKDVQASKRQSVRDLANKLKGQVHEGPPVMRKKEPGAKKKRAKVVYSYDPENDDELKLDVGDMLDVLKQEEEGWWEGINNGKQGMFPSNFVEIVEDSSESTTENTETKTENTEEHLIKGKKIQGIGLGNIFGDGPIKLRSTANKKPVDRPAEPPKAESRTDSAQRKLKELKKGLGIHPLAACPDPRCHKAQDFVEIKAFLGENIDFFDADLVYIEEAEKYLESLSSGEGVTVNEEELLEYADIDVNPSDFDCNDNVECKPNFAGYDSSSSSDYGGDVDCNNNMLFYEGSVGFAGVKEIRNKSNGVDQNIVDAGDALNDSPLDNWKAVLHDLDKCLDITPDDEEEGDKNICVEKPCLEECNTAKDSDACSNNQSMDTSQECIGDTYERMQSLNCWKHTMLTPPEKLNFYKAIDSVYVTKHRLIESADRSKIEQTPVHGSSNSDRNQKEHAARSLNYATGDLGSTGFVKFAQDIDENGHKVLIPKPLDYHRPEVTLNNRISTSETKSVSNTKTDDTYFNSQNRSGHLSPFIRSIANRYHLFESSKPHFKQLNIGELRTVTDEESYAMGMLRHQAGCMADTKVDQHETSMDENPDLANPVVNQMVNNYVYDVITNEHSKPVNDIDQKISDIAKQEDDVSMAVCVDDNSLRGVNSKEDLEDSTQEIEETSTLLNMTGSSEQSPTIVSNKIPSGNQQWQSTPNKQTDDVSPSIVTKTMLHVKKGLAGTPQPHLVKKLPVHGIIRQRSAFCRISFSNDAPSFWFSKDFSESPKCKQEVLKKVRSPKRSSSEISQDVPLLADMAEQTCLNDFKAKIEAFKKDHSEFSSNYSPCSSDHRSPAKKKRKKITCNAMTDKDTSDELFELNTNSNALNELDQSNVRAFFPPKLHDDPTPNFVDSPVLENKPREGRKRKIRKIVYKSSSSNLPIKITGKKYSVSFASSFPDLQDRHSMKKRRILGKKSKTLAKSPVKLLSFKQWDAIGSPVGRTAKIYQHKSSSMGDIFQNFEAYTHNTLNFPKKQCTGSALETADNHVTIRNEDDTGVRGVKTYFKFDNEADDDYVFEVLYKVESPKDVRIIIYESDGEDFDHDENNSVSAYFQHFDSPDSLEETAEVSPIKIDQQFLSTSSRENQPEHHEMVGNHVEQAVKEHLEVTNNVTQGSAEFATMTRTRMNLYSAISAAIQSYAPNYVEADLEMCSGQTEDGKKQADLTDQEKSIDNGDVTPDADELISDLNGLNLSDTPLYANPEADDDDMKVFLNEAVQSLDNILVDSFNSFSESPIKEQTMNKDGNELNESGTSDGEELQDDSILKVVGKKCVLHKMEEREYIACGEPQDSFEVHDPDFAVIGKKCVLHETHPDIKTIPKDINDVEEDSLNEAVQKLVDYVMEDIGKNPETLDDLETNNNEAAKSDAIKMDVNVRDCCAASVDYDEAYDCDGNVTDESCDEVRHPAYMCSSPLIPFYCTADTLNTDEVEKSFATNISPNLYDANEDPGVLNQTEDDLDRTRGSSLDEDLEDTGEDFEFVEESEVDNDDTGCNYVGLEDIQNRMQDSGKWFDKMEDVHDGLNDLEDTAEHLSCSTMSSNAPPVFEEKVSAFPSPKIHGNES